jgi:cyclic beta-1,2-glucan synthetase
MYQSGGAVGFRDQLQDHVNLLWLDREACRRHILTCCAHQYVQGDVQHWWHPGPGETDKGVRTRCSDDLLWLPWAVCEYTDATGDLALCREAAPYIDSPVLEDRESSRYELPALSGEEGSVLDHCHRALWLVLQRGLGDHRLLLILSGDWNDGFDRMGPGAESVWLTWFASIVFHRFGLLLDALGEKEADRYEEAARSLGQSADQAWDGDHYLRGYYGDGTPLGADGEAGCAIDSVAQSFAAFCPYADRKKVDAALETALSRLWDRERHIIRLYDPPFAPEDRAPGYAVSYGPGFRENGGQYTHAAVWLARACFRTGRWADGAALLEDMVLSARTKEYGAEPFVLAADVYTAPGREGRAGWSWYTGAAGWWYRTAWQDMLGFSEKRGRASFTPPAEAAEQGWRMAFRPEHGLSAVFPSKEQN